MSLFTRPSVVFAIVFGCFAVLVPRVFIPLFRPKPSLSSHSIDDNFRRPPPSIRRSDNDDTIEHIPGSPPHIRGAHPNTQMQNPAVDGQQQLSTDQNSSKSVVTFALPMYTVGIGVFFIYTCCKYWSKRNTQEDKIKDRYSSSNIRWNADRKKFKYDINNRYIEDEEENEENLYAGLDSDYVEYLKAKKQKELDTEQAMNTDQKQMHYALDEMKNSLSFISSKLVTNETKGNLSNNEISELQNRLASTEAQMAKILNALDVASTKVNELTKNTRKSLEQTQPAYINEEEHHLSSRSPSESEDSSDEEENSNSDDNSFHQDEQVPINNKQEGESSSSSYEEEEEEVPKQIEEEDDDESESSSERYGVMTTNYGCDPTTIDDYELNTINKSDQVDDSRAKVKEWHQRNHSQSLSSSNSSIENDQSIPNDEQNRLSRRKCQQ